MRRFFFEILPHWIMALATIVLGIFAYKAWREAQGQLHEMQRSNRPWIGLSTQIMTVTPLTFDDAGAHVVVRFRLKNAGVGIAKGVNPIVGLLNIGPLPLQEMPRGVIAPAQMVELVKRATGGSCDPKSMQQIGDISGDLVIPNATIAQEEFSFRSGNPTQFKYNTGTGDVSAWTKFCVGYEDDSGAPHATGFVLFYRAANDQTHFAPKGIIDGKLEIFPFGSEAY